MNEIEFRGKDIDNKEWVYGSYFAHQKIRLCMITQQNEVERNTQHLIVQDKIAGDWNFPNGIQGLEIIPETIGQYVGLEDKNKRKIFKGDIVKFNNQIGIIVFECGSFGIGFKDCINYKNLEKLVKKKTGNFYNGICNDNFISLFEIYWNFNEIESILHEVEVIGNIFDNKELLD